jgi:hypothetical protein
MGTDMFAPNGGGRLRMAIHTVKCGAGCGGVLRHYEEMAPMTWAHNIRDPELSSIDGKNIIQCPDCGALNEVEQPQIQGVIRVIGVLADD